MDKKIYNMANDIVTDLQSWKAGSCLKRKSGNISAASEKMEGRKKHTGAG